MPAPEQNNRLIRETSPYLLQHAHNPVNWYAWGEEAFTAARAEDKPILLSIGYSACHWCHVMERESFENEAIAAQMNKDYVNIKVDREERPDVDAIYMRAVQMLTGQGGWPMTMFLTPDGTPFYGGTYFPPEDHYGRPGFPRVLEAVAVAWKSQRADILEQSQSILQNLEHGNDFIHDLPDTLLTPALFDNAFNALAAQFDRIHGGFGSAPKFPQPANLDFLLHYHARSKRQEPLAMVEKTLQRMALGGIYDQLGGGFHRYSTDATWLAPHFEKMLYDNAQLAQIYCRAFQATGKAFYQGVAEETLEYVMREMTGPEGGFYSAQDADSEGVEGKFFVWMPEEIVTLLGERDAEVFNAFYDVTPHGNWEESNILHVVMDAPEVAAKFGLEIKDAAEILDNGRIKLFEAREKRIKPALDDKILTAWNGLMLAAFAECAAVFQRDDFRDVAIKNAEFLCAKMVYTDSTGATRLYRTYRNGEAKLNAYLEDYAFFIDGLLQLYQATYDVRWIQKAQELMRSMEAYFWDDENIGFFTTSSDHEQLIQRPKDWDDNATPAGNSVALDVLLKMSFLVEDSVSSKATGVLRKLGPVLEKHPYGFARMLCVLDLYLSTPKQIAIIGDPQEEATRALLHAVYQPYIPNKVVALGPQPEEDSLKLSLLAERSRVDGKPTAYVCENYSCKLPVTTAEELTLQLQKE